MQPRDEDTGRLVLIANSGDDGAVHRLLLRYHRPLEDYIRGQCGPALLQKESGSDLAQSVCREVLQELARGGFEYRGEAEFRQWLYRAALNKVRMRARHWGARRRDAGRENGDAEGHAVTDTPSRAAFRREQGERLHDALARLSEEQRKVVRWARFEGLSHAEIAARLGVTESHSRTLLARAMARLARIVAD